MKIPEGYRLAVLDPDGTVVDTIDAAGYDTGKHLASALLIDEIEVVIARSEASRA